MNSFVKMGRTRIHTVLHPVSCWPTTYLPGLQHQTTLSLSICEAEYTADIHAEKKPLPYFPCSKVLQLSIQHMTPLSGSQSAIKLFQNQQFHIYTKHHVPQGFVWLHPRYKPNKLLNLGIGENLQACITPSKEMEDAFHDQTVTAPLGMFLFSIYTYATRSTYKYS